MGGCTVEPNGWSGYDELVRYCQEDPEQAIEDGVHCVDYLP